jgi:hypothetical protein
MGALICPQGTENYLEAVADSLLYGQVELYQLPSSVAALYYLGESSLIGYLKKAQADADRYYRAASRGTFSTPLKPQGLTFAELCRVRGQEALAERLEADFKKLSFNVGGAL